MQRLAASFILGYHGCDRAVGEALLQGQPFRESSNPWDWLGGGVYFWEANPQRGLDFARKAMVRKGSRITDPAVVGAVIDLGACLDLTTAVGIQMVRDAYASLTALMGATLAPLPVNESQLKRHLDRAVVDHLHAIYRMTGGVIDTVRGVFTEGEPVYPGAGFDAETHIQVAVRNPACIKGVFRVPPEHLLGPEALGLQ